MKMNINNKMNTSEKENESNNTKTDSEEMTATVAFLDQLTALKQLGFVQTIRGQTLILTRNFTFTAPASAAAINKQPKTIQFEINASQDKPYPVTPPLVRVMIPDGYRVVSNSDCKIITAGGILLPTYVKEWNQKESTLIDLYMYLESELADHPPLFELVSGSAASAASTASAAAASGNDSGWSLAAATTAAIKALGAGPLNIKTVSEPPLTLAAHEMYDFRDSYGKWELGVLKRFLDQKKSEVEADSPHRKYCEVQFIQFADEKFNELIDCSMFDVSPSQAAVGSTAGGPQPPTKWDDAKLKSRIRMAGSHTNYIGPANQISSWHLKQSVIGLNSSTGVWKTGFVTQIDGPQIQISEEWWVHIACAEIIPTPVPPSAATPKVVQPIASVGSGGSGGGSVKPAATASGGGGPSPPQQQLLTTDGKAASGDGKSAAALEKEENDNLERAIAASAADYEKWKTTPTQEAVTIPSSVAGYIIGKNSAHLHNIEKETKTTILSQPQQPNATTASLLVMGVPEAISAAIVYIREQVRKVAPAPAAAAEPAGANGGGRGRGRRGGGRGGLIVPTQVINNNASVAVGSGGRGGGGGGRGSGVHLSDRHIAALSGPARGRGHVHVFIDWSNITLGAKDVGGAALDHLVRVKPNVLATTLEHGRPTGHKMVAGSHPPADSPVWKMFEAMQYRVKWAGVSMRREDGKRGESLIDDALHAGIYSALTDADGHGQHDAKQDAKHPQNILVLATGDGAVNREGTTFPAVCKTALKMGWAVEIWSWKKSLNSIYYQLARDESHKRQLTVHFLDAARDQLCKREENFKTHVVSRGGGSGGGGGGGGGGRGRGGGHRGGSSGGGSGSATLPPEPKSPDSKHHDSDNARDASEDLCVLCQVKPKAVAFVPCGHVCLCIDCSAAERFTSCFVCNKSATGYERV